MKKIILLCLPLLWNVFAHAQVPDTTVIGSIYGVPNGGPACGYMISCTINYNMPPGDQLYLEKSDYSWCAGTTSPFYRVTSGPDISYNWYLGPSYCWQGNSFGPQFCYAALSPNMCSISTSDLRFVYVSATGSGIHASVTNIVHYPDHPPYPRMPDIAYINSACNIPQDVDFNFNFKPGCSSTSGDDIHAYIYYGDGKDTVIWTYPPYPSIFTIPLTHTYDLPGIYSVKVKGNIERVIYDAVRIGMDSCSNVSGKLYADLNNNCTYDAGDSVFVSYPIRISANGQSIYFAITDSSGNYSFTLPDNGSVYQINFDTVSNGLHLVCPLSGYTVASLPSSGNDFAANCQAAFDLRSGIYASRFLPGVTTSVYTNVRNMNCNSTNASVKFVKSPLLTFVNAQALPDSVVGDTLYWNYPNILFSNPFFNHLWFFTDTLATTADTVCLTLITEPVLNDFNPADNIYQLCRGVNASFDPNNKELIIADDGSLIYTINFENTGTAYARNAFILDTLDFNLDLNTFRLEASSHPVKVNFYNGNILKFSFDSIMLPFGSDNTGFVAYSIRPKMNPAYESVIKNKAWIFFDWNKGIGTNTAYYRISNALTNASDIYPAHYSNSIFPNPAKDKIFFKYGHPVNAEVFNVFGQKAAEIKNSDHLSIAHLHAGVYTIFLTDAAGKLLTVEKLVKE